MLPPIDEAVLKNNPDFERVYKKVTGALLNADGSTREDAVAKKREAVRQELREYRLKATRRHLLRHAIKTAAPSSSESSSSESTQQPPPLSTTAAAAAAAASSRPSLQQRRTRSSSSIATTNTNTTNTSSQQQQQQQQLPEELIEIIYLLPPFLTHAPTLPPASLALLLTSAPLSSLPAHFPQLLSRLSAGLAGAARAVARITHPSTNSAYLHRAVPSLGAAAAGLAEGVGRGRAALSAARLRAARALGACLDRSAAATARLLRLLEARHGPAARSTALRAEAAALDARAWALASRALRWRELAAWYPAEARAALANYRRHLAGAKMRLGDAVRVREAELREFGVRVDGGMMVAGEAGAGEEEETVGVGKSSGSGGSNSKEKTMREMARVYREMQARMDEVRADLERLGMS